MRTDVTLDEALEIVRDAREREVAERTAEAMAFVGRCFRYRNCYSLPQGTEDYWYLYAIVQGADAGWCKGLTFQRDKDGRIEIRIDDTMRIYPGSGWEEIDLAAFQAAADNILDLATTRLQPWAGQ
jgi:hypothetical protein